MSHSFEAGFLHTKAVFFRIHVGREFTVGADFYWRPWGLTLYSRVNMKERFCDIGKGML